MTYALLALAALLVVFLAYRLRQLPKALAERQQPLQLLKSPPQGWAGPNADLLPPGWLDSLNGVTMQTRMMVVAPEMTPADVCAKMLHAAGNPCPRCGAPNA